MFNKFDSIKNCCINNQINVLEEGVLTNNWAEYKKHQTINYISVDHEYIDKICVLGDNLLVLCLSENYVNFRSKVQELKTLDEFFKTEVLMSFDCAPFKIDHYAYEFVDSHNETINKILDILK